MTRLAVCVFVVGCYSSGELGVPDVDPSIDAGAVRDATVRDAALDARLASDAAPDAPADRDSATIPEEWVPLTPAQAECFGLTHPDCASCHVAPGTDVWVLRPGFAPPPPGGILFEPRDCL
jgi:hypothetical protein